MMPNAIYRVEAEMIVSKSLKMKLELTAPFSIIKRDCKNQVAIGSIWTSLVDELAHDASRAIDGLGTRQANFERQIDTPLFSSTM